jgi:NitT/TauT family transport system substrate-binding protein
MNIRRTTMFRLAAVFLTATLTLIGSIGSASADTQIEPKAASAPLVPINMTVGYSANGLNYAELFVADALGIFKKHGLDVTLKRVNSSSQAIPAIRSGSINIVASGGDAAITAVANGITDVTILGDMVQAGILEVWVQPEIKSPQDLIGKIISSTSPQSMGDILTGAWLKQNGVQRNQVHIVYLGGLGNLVAGMRSKATAATLILPPLGNQLAATGQKKLADLRNVPYSGHAYIAKKSYVKANPEAIRRFFKATIEATAVLKQEKARVLPIFPKYTGVENPALNEYAYEFYKDVWEKVPVVKMNVLKATQQLSSSEKDKAVNLDDLVDNSFVEKLKAEGYIDSLYKK